MIDPTLVHPPEVVVDAMMLTEGRNREEIVRCWARCQAFRGGRYRILQVSPKNPASGTGVEIGPDDGWAFFDLAINYRDRTDTEKILIHGTSQSSLWGILGGMQVTASTASEEVWTSLRAVEACTLLHYGRTRGREAGFALDSLTRRRTCSGTNLRYGRQE